MSDINHPVIRQLSMIPAVPTAHGVGYKQVFLADDETISKVTQIARNLIPAGYDIESHVHPSMDEHFFFLEGNGEIVLNHRTVKCEPGVFILVPAGTVHSMRANDDLHFLTFSVAL